MDTLDATLAELTLKKSENASLVSPSQEMITQRRRQIPAGAAGGGGQSSSAQSSHLPYSKREESKSMAWLTPLAGLSALLLIVVFIVYMVHDSNSSESESISKGHSRSDSGGKGPSVKVTDEHGGSVVMDAADLVRSQTADVREARLNHLDQQRERFADLRGKFDEMRGGRARPDGGDTRRNDNDDEEAGDRPGFDDARERLERRRERYGRDNIHRDRVIEEFEKENARLREQMINLKTSMRDLSNPEERDELINKLQDLRQRQKDLHSDHREKLREGMRADREARRARMKDGGVDDDLPGLDLSGMEDRREQLLRRRRERLGSEERWLRSDRDRHRPKRPCIDHGSSRVCDAAVESGDCPKLRGVCDKSCNYCSPMAGSDEMESDNEEEGRPSILLHERIKEEERLRNRDSDSEMEYRRARRPRRERLDRRDRASLGDRGAEFEDNRERIRQ